MRKPRLFQLATVVVSLGYNFAQPAAPKPDHQPQGGERIG